MVVGFCQITNSVLHNMVEEKDLRKGFKFTLGSIPCTIQFGSLQSTFVVYTEDAGTGSATIDKQLLLSKLNRN